MTFSEKLVFLMDLTHTSNIDLAHFMGVDPSLISLYKTGRRKLPKNQEHAHKISDYFAKNISSEYMLRALNEVLETTVILYDTPVEEMANLIFLWLTDNLNVYNNMLSKLNKKINSATIEYEKNQKEVVKVDIPTIETTFYNNDGKREAVLLFLRYIASLDTPVTFYFFADEDRDWYLEDFVFIREYEDLLHKILAKGNRIVHIFPNISNSTESVDVMSRWLPFYITAQFEVYFYPGLRDELFRKTLFVCPEHLMLYSSSVKGTRQSNFCFVSSDTRKVTAAMAEFNSVLAKCVPLLKMVNSMADFTNCIKRSLIVKCRVIKALNILAVESMPKDMLLDIYCNVEDNDYKELIQAFIDNTDNIPDLYTNYEHIDIIKIHTVEEIRSKRVPMITPLGIIDNPPMYTLKTYADHLENIVNLMNEYPKYSCIPFFDEKNSYFNIITCENSTSIVCSTIAPHKTYETFHPSIVSIGFETMLAWVNNTGYKGTHKSKNITLLNDYIKFLRSM